MGNEKPAAATWGTNPARPTGSGSDGSIAQCNPIDRILPRLEGVKAAGPKKWTARCPSHDDRKASLGLAEAANGTVLLTCRTGCAFAAVVAAVDLKPADLFPDTGRRGGSIRCPKPEPRITRYEYRSADGAHVATKGRKDLPNGDKQPFWELPDGRSGLNGYRIADLPLYRLPELKAADPGDPVLLVEGEKATEAARRLGFTATTCAGGAGQRDFGKALEELAGRIVYLWPDNDAAGRELMDQIAERLEGIAAAVYRLEVPGLPEKGDAADFEAAGRTADELRDLMARAPLYRDYTIAWMRQRLADVEEKATQTDYWRERAIEAETKVEQIERVVADKDLKAEVRTAVGLILHGPEWQAKAGAAGVVQRTYLGYWAERFGESTQTVSKHFKRFAASGWLHFDVDTSDPMKSAAYLALPGTAVAEIAAPIAGSNLEREGQTWGGPGNRYCHQCGEDVPVVIKTTVEIRCAHCGELLHRKSRTKDEPLPEGPPDGPSGPEFQDGSREPDAHDHDPAPASEDVSPSYVYIGTIVGSRAPTMPSSKMDRAASLIRAVRTMPRWSGIGARWTNLRRTSLQSRNPRRSRPSPSDPRRRLSAL